MDGTVVAILEKLALVGMRVGSLTVGARPWLWCEHRMAVVTTIVGVDNTFIVAS